LIPKKKKKIEKEEKKPTFETPEDIYNVNLIAEKFEESILLIPTSIATMIQQRKRLAEDRVYLGVMGEDQDYLGRLYGDGGDHNYYKFAVTELLDDINNNILNEVDVGQHQVHHRIKVTKDELQMMGSPKQFRDIRSRLQNNISSLKSEMTIDDTSNSHQQFSLQSEKTKKAEEFIKKIHEKQLAADKVKHERKVKQ